MSEVSRKRNGWRGWFGVGVLIAAGGLLATALSIFSDLPTARTQFASLLTSAVIQKTLQPEARRTSAVTAPYTWILKIEQKGSQQVDDLSIEILAGDEGLITSLQTRNLPQKSTYETSSIPMRIVVDREPVNLTEGGTQGATSIVIRIPYLADRFEVGFLISTSTATTPLVNITTLSQNRNFTVWDYNDPGFFQRVSRLWAEYAETATKMSLNVLTAGLIITVMAVFLPLVGFIAIPLFGLVEIFQAVVKNTTEELKLALNIRSLPGRVSDISNSLVVFIGSLRSVHDRADVAYFCAFLYLVLSFVGTGFGSISDIVIWTPPESLASGAHGAADGRCDAPIGGESAVALRFG